MVENTVEAYNALLNQYNNEVETLRKRLADAKDVNGDPVGMINSRMTTSDEYLAGPIYSPFYIEAKHRLIPLIIELLALHDGLSAEQLAEFNDRKNKTGEHRGVEALIALFSPLSLFVAREIKNEKMREDRLKIPLRPSNKNAWRKLQEYDEEKKQYDRDREVIDKNINEFQSLLEKYKKLQPK